MDMSLIIGFRNSRRKGAGIAIALTFLLLIICWVSVFHFHKDGTTEDNCPLCILHVALSIALISPALALIIIIIYAKLVFDNISLKQSAPKFDIFISRAPPSFF